MIYLVRHGQTDWNLKHKIQGSAADIPLNAAGREQAAARAAAFDGAHFDAVITSPLSRAVETGKIIAQDAEVDAFCTDARLAERDFGPMDGVCCGKHKLDFYFQPFDGAEPMAHVAARVGAALENIAETYTGDVLVVSHGAACGSWLRGQLGSDDFWLSNTSCILIDPDGCRLVGYNLTNEAIKDALKNSQRT